MLIPIRKLVIATLAFVCLAGPTAQAEIKIRETDDGYVLQTDDRRVVIDFEPIERGKIERINPRYILLYRRFNEDGKRHIEAQIVSIETGALIGEFYGPMDEFNSRWGFSETGVNYFVSAADDYGDSYNHLTIHMLPSRGDYRKHSVSFPRGTSTDSSSYGVLTTPKGIFIDLFAKYRDEQGQNLKSHSLFLITLDGVVRSRKDLKYSGYGDLTFRSFWSTQGLAVTVHEPLIPARLPPEPRNRIRRSVAAAVATITTGGFMTITSNDWPWWVKTLVLVGAPAGAGAVSYFFQGADAHPEMGGTTQYFVVDSRSGELIEEAKKPTEAPPLIPSPDFDPEWKCEVALGGK